MKAKDKDGKMVDISELKFDEKGLIPAVVADAATGRVLTLAYMNEESLRISLDRKLTCFYSRSRGELWLKGETSGNYQHIVSVTADCDRDALLVRVVPDGPACHLGTFSCFEYPVFPETAPESGKEEFSYEGLMELIAGRKTDKKEGSYTSYLFEKGLDKILKKIGEESTEVIIAAKDRDKKETVYEIADLAYHVMVLMTEAGITLGDIRDELASRHVIDKKVKQEKMTS
jgi:phosphoribosyl-ATP pyrophosphohydrolase/phosphoribosyl-AMP cyclohydrolase